MSYKSRHNRYGARKAKREWLKVPITENAWGKSRWQTFTYEPPPEDGALRTLWITRIDPIMAQDFQRVMAKGLYPEIRKYKDT